MALRWLAIFAILGAPLAFAQGRGAALELGLGGEVVAGAWNPLTLTVRDRPGAELLIVIDQGTFQGGEILAQHRFSLPAVSGLQRLEEDLFVPSWRSFTWRIRTPEEVIASGSFDRRRQDSRPLTLIVSDRPSQWLALLDADVRALALPPGLLPERLAAYDGVARVIVDGSTAAPAAEALVAAATAGADTLLVEPLPASYASLLKLAPYREQRLGAGRLLRVGLEAVPSVLSEARLPAGSALVGMVLAADPLEPPAPILVMPILALAGAYTLATLLLLRFFRLPGLLSSLVLAAVVAFYGWTALRAHDPQLERTQVLVIASGPLAREDAVKTVYSYPKTTLELPTLAHPSVPTAYRQENGVLRLELRRSEQVELALEPRLLSAPLVWEGGQLVNRSGAPLHAVLVKGLGPQPDLAAAQALMPRSHEEGPLPQGYEALLAHLPLGSALATQGDTLMVALPSAPRVTGGLP